MTPAEMHLEPFSNELKSMPESFGQNTGVPFGIDDFSPKSFGSRTDDLLNLLQ